MPASTMESTMAGPAWAAAAWPVRTKMPVPMIAPIPSAVRSIGPSTRLSCASPPARDFSSSMDLVAKRLTSI